MQDTVATLEKVECKGHVTEDIFLKSQFAN